MYGVCVCVCFEGSNVGIDTATGMVIAVGPLILLTLKNSRNTQSLHKTKQAGRIYTTCL